MTEWEKKHVAPPKTETQRKLDDFWDVESLLPAKPSRPIPPPPRQTPSAVDIELTPRTSAAVSDKSPLPVGATPLTIHRNGGGKEASKSDYRRPMPAPRPASQPNRNSTAPENTVHYVPPHKEDENSMGAPLLEYEPAGVLLHRVKVYGWQANYHYFDQFTKDAERYAAMEAPKEARRESFFSYFPQYVQLGRRATAWYLYWRECVRHGQYPDTDYAYVLLYLFELINLPAEEVPVARLHRDLMAKVWMAYRRTYPQLDHYMCEWLCDYCLIHKLPAPVDLLAQALDDIILGSRLKEFYLSAAVRVPTGDSDAPNTALETARILMRHCCQYDYRKSKFASGEHKALFDKIIPAAVASVIPLLLGADGAKPAVTLLDSTLTRDAYVGALCSYQNKRKIEVAYTSFSRSHELRFLIGDMVKHIENRLRSWIGVRSRLSVMSLPIPLRDALDAYLNPLAPPKAAMPVQKREEPRPAYEALYDLPRKEVSLADAAAIEAESWATTKILVEAFETEDGEEQDVSRANEANDFCQASLAHDVAPLESTVEIGESTGSGAISSLAPYAHFIKAALDRDSAALRTAAKALGKMPDALADEINALTADGEIGDIILEDDGMGGYTVIEDYREPVRKQVIELL